MGARGVVAVTSALVCACIGAAASSGAAGTPRFTPQRPLPPAPGRATQADAEPGSTGRLSVVFTSDLLHGKVVPSYTAYVTER